MATQLANRTTGAVSDELIERAHQRADAAREPRRHAAESSSPPATASRSRTQSESSARRWEHATSRARASSPRSSTTGSRTSRPIRSRTTSPVPAEPTQRDVWFADLDPWRRARPCERSPSSPSASGHLVARQAAGLSYDEIAAETGDSWRTVDRQLCRARAQIPRSRGRDLSGRAF